MKLSTNLEGRLRNTKLPFSRGLMPLFEAIANSIHAIEELGERASEGRIRIQIHRDPQVTILKAPQRSTGRDTLKNIVGFTITDNGVGFNQRNMASFCTLDSDYKAARGGRGVGRLLWLKAFSRAEIDSVTEDADSNWIRRRFTFSRLGLSDNQEKETDSRELRTRVRLIGFEKKYRQGSPKSAQSISRSLLEHLLWYFIRPGGAPAVQVEDDEVSIDLSDIYEEYMASAETEMLTLKEHAFELIHVHLRAGTRASHSLAYCANSRVAEEEPLATRIPGLRKDIEDSNGSFVYQCYISSPFLDENVRSERTGLDISEGRLDLLDDVELAREEIREGVIQRVEAHLAEHLSALRRRSRDRIEQFITRRAPRFRPILHRIPESQLDIDPESTDKELELKLQSHLFELESQLLEEGQRLMNPLPEDAYENYTQRMQGYIDMVDDIKKSDLANYVFHRKATLDLLKDAISRRADGKYPLEENVHRLIMPLRIDSNDLRMEHANLWLLDERLAFHDYLASDRTIKSMPITSSEDRKEPDICSLQLYDTPVLVSENDSQPQGCLTIVEIKRPMRDDAAAGEQKDPIEQALGYLDRIRDGKVTTQRGRPILNAQNIPAFIYIVADLTPSLLARCRVHDLSVTSDGAGYFGFNKSYGAYIEVHSFDRVVNDATKRNHAFFAKLGLPVT